VSLLRDQRKIRNDRKELQAIVHNLSEDLGRNSFETLIKRVHDYEEKQKKNAIRKERVVKRLLGSWDSELAECFANRWNCKKHWKTWRQNTNMRRADSSKM